MHKVRDFHSFKNFLHMTHMTHICDKVFVAMSIPLSQARIGMNDFGIVATLQWQVSGSKCKNHVKPRHKSCFSLWVTLKND